MGDFGYENDDDEFDFDFSGQGNDALKQARKAARDNAKLVKELRAQLEEQGQTLASLQTEKRQSTVADLLKAKGANPSLARWLAKDDVEATDEAVSKWLDENGEVFGYKPAGNTGIEEGDASEGDAQGEGDSAMADMIAAMQRVQDGEATATPGLSPNRKLDQAIADLGKSAQSQNDVVAGLKKLGLI